MERTIFDNCKIHPSAYIGPYCIIGGPAENRKTWPSDGFALYSNYNVVISENSKLTGSNTVDAGTVRPTQIGANCMLMKSVHVGHDAIIEDNVTIACHALIGGFAVICQGANIGLNATIHQRCVIPPFCMIGMGAVVTKTASMQPFDVWVGNPAKYLKFNEWAVKHYRFSDDEVKTIISDFNQKVY